MRPLVFTIGLVGYAAAFQQLPLAAPPPTALLSVEFDAFASDLLRQWAVPGLSLGIVKVEIDGQLQTEFRGYGTAGKGRKVDENVRLFGFPLARLELTFALQMLFGIASNSKVGCLDCFGASSSSPTSVTGHHRRSGRSSRRPGQALVG